MRTGYKIAIALGLAAVAGYVVKRQLEASPSAPSLGPVPSDIAATFRARIGYYQAAPQEISGCTDSGGQVKLADGTQIVAKTVCTANRRPGDVFDASALTDMQGLADLGFGIYVSEAMFGATMPDSIVIASVWPTQQPPAGTRLVIAPKGAPNA